jgi:hypothetical protein
VTARYRPFRRRQVRDDLEAALTTLLERWGHAYDIGGWQGAWQATHQPSGTALRPARTLDGLDATIGRDAWQRPVRTAGGLSIAIRAARR